MVGLGQSRQSAKKAEVSETEALLLVGATHCSSLTSVSGQVCDTTRAEPQGRGHRMSRGTVAERSGNKIVRFRFRSKGYHETLRIILFRRTGERTVP